MKRPFTKMFVTDVAAWRTSLLAVILRTALILGCLVCIPSVIMAQRAGLIGVIVIDVLAIALLAALIYLKQLPYTIRATIFCLILYGLGAGLLVWVGSISQIFLLAFSILTALLLGTRAGLTATLLSTGTLLLIGLRTRRYAAHPGHRNHDLGFGNGAASGDSRSHVI